MHLVLHHYWRSSSSWRVRFVLAHKGLAYESRAVDLLAGEQAAPEHVAKSPMGTVPCLVVDGRPLTESVAIAEYLDEAAPGPKLLPEDAWARARVRQLVEIVNSGIQPLHNLRILRAVSPDAEPQKAWARAAIERGLLAYESLLGEIARELGPGRYSVGDAITLADAFLLPQVYQARRFGASIDGLPRLRAVHALVAATPAAIVSAPEKQPDAPKS